jgi:hypothetical protein
VPVNRYGEARPARDEPLSRFLWLGWVALVGLAAGGLAWPRLLAALTLPP